MIRGNKKKYREDVYRFLRSQGHNVATNYRQRARKVIGKLLWGVKVIAGPKRWKDPSEEMMESFIDELPGIMTLSSIYTGKTYNLPLTEEQMTEIEQNMASKKSTFINTGNIIGFCIEPITNKTSNKENN